MYAQDAPSEPIFDRVALVQSDSHRIYLNAFRLFYDIALSPHSRGINVVHFLGTSALRTRFLISISPRTTTLL